LNVTWLSGVAFNGSPDNQHAIFSASPGEWLSANEPFGGGKTIA
jgi:hypothetical protein